MYIYKLIIIEIMSPVCKSALLWNMVLAADVISNSTFLLTSDELSGESFSTSFSELFFFCESLKQFK